MLPLLAGMIAGGGVSGGMGIIGDQLEAAQNRQAMRASADLQREFAKHGVQWRVEDAKAAGLHPLAALGMMPASASPIAIGSNTGSAFERAGQHLGGAIASQMSDEDKEMHVANLRVLNSQADKYDAEKASILFSIAEQQRAASTPSPLGLRGPGMNHLPDGQVPNAPIGLGDDASGVYELKAPPVMTSEPSAPEIQSGTVPGVAVQRLHPRLNMLMPSGEGQEATNEIWNETPTWEKILYFNRNINHYGPGWLKDYFRVKSGLEPEGTYTDKVTHPEGRTSTLVQPSPLKDAIDRAIKSTSNIPRRFKRKFNKWAEQLP